MHWIEQRLIGQEPRSGRGLSDDISRERGRHRSCSKSHHPSGVHLCLAGGGKDSDCARVGDTCLTYEERASRSRSSREIDIVWNKTGAERTVIERRWASSLCVFSWLQVFVLVLLDCAMLCLHPKLGLYSIAGLSIWGFCVCTMVNVQHSITMVH